MIIGQSSCSRKGFIEHWQGFGVLVVLWVVVGLVVGSVVGSAYRLESHNQLSCGYCG